MPIANQARAIMRSGIRASVCLASLALPVQAQVRSGSLPIVDLRSGTLNGRPLSTWTLDAVTDSFGRPTAVTSPVGGIVGPQLHYHTRGISLWFHPKEKNPSQQLWLVTIYVARSWDGPHSMWYEMFKGGIAPAVDANWKQSQLMKEFASLTPTSRTVEESRKAASSSGLTKLGVRSPQSDFVYVTSGKTLITFALEPNTKFLERVILRTAEDSLK